MDDFRSTGVLALAASVRAGHVSARELTAVALAAIERTDSVLNAFCAVDGDRAMGAAAEVDARIARGEDPGPLAGVPLAVKDTEDTVGYRTTFGSRLWADASPAQRDSVLVDRLKRAGCVVVGKTTTPELASKGSCDSPLLGVTRNPWDPTRTCGGSSGGSAAAVSAGMVPLATGSDGGGSIRIPSSACGLTGFKPSLGRVPDGGPQPVDWHHLTSRGVLVRDAADVVAVHDVIIGPHPTDLRSLPAPVRPWADAVAGQELPRRIGWCPTLGYAEVDPEVEDTCHRAVLLLEAAGVEVVPMPTLFDEDPVRAWITLVAAYNARTLAPFADRLHDAELDPTTRFFLTVADTLTATDVVEAEDACHRLNLRLVDAFASVDLIASPTLAALPPLAVLADPDTGWVRHTYPFNMTRSPAGTVTAGFSSGGLPIGLQLVGPQHADVSALHLLGVLEDLVGLDRRPVVPAAH
jgi:aspartyl-tRNA(Asn)/glutamyl-tRNA(Gln) amidotransferase subunit A